MTKEENKIVSEPNFYEEYEKNTPKTLTLGRHIACLSRIAKHFDCTVHTLVDEKGNVEINRFEMQAHNLIDYAFLQELFNAGYMISDIKLDAPDRIRLLIEANTLLSFTWLMRSRLP